MFCIPKILKNESNSQQYTAAMEHKLSCFVSQRYWKMKAIHNKCCRHVLIIKVVLYPKDTEKWKQFTTHHLYFYYILQLFCIPKILKNESNSQLSQHSTQPKICCFVSQRYWKMKAIHNRTLSLLFFCGLFCIPKILKNESNSQLVYKRRINSYSCFVSQRYWKMKAIHNFGANFQSIVIVVLYPKDTEKWKQFTTESLKYFAI